jgi:serine/threonine protein kinase
MSERAANHSPTVVCRAGARASLPACGIPAAEELLPFTVDFDPVEGEGHPIAGTPRYMAPEQLAGATLTPAADWYAFGLTLRQAITGEPPRFPTPHGPATGGLRARGFAVPEALDARGGGDRAIARGVVLMQRARLPRTPARRVCPSPAPASTGTRQPARLLHEAKRRRPMVATR